MAEPALDLSQIPDVENPYDDTWYEEQNWSPEPELRETPLVLSRAKQKLPDVPKLKPSQFTERVFMMPRDEGNGFAKFSFDGRRHLKRVYNTPSRRVLLCCGRQVEKSTMLGNIALCYMSLVAAMRILYVSPSATQTKTFSNDRVKEPIETSPMLKRFTTKMLSQNIL